MDLNFLTKESESFYPKMFQYPQTKYDPGSKICSQGAKYFNTPILHTTLLFCSGGNLEVK